MSGLDDLFSMYKMKMENVKNKYFKPPKNNFNQTYSEWLLPKERYRNGKPHERELNSEEQELFKVIYSSM